MKNKKLNIIISAVTSFTAIIGVALYGIIRRKKVKNK